MVARPLVLGEPGRYRTEELTVLNNVSQRTNFDL
jgi:hypothetical protein